MSHCAIPQLLLLAVTLASATGAALAPQAASAQTRAALVRNIDEPGRQPYAEDVVGTCNAVNCRFDFAVVPADKRLVIEYISAIARSSSTATIYSSAELLTNSTVNASLAVRHNFKVNFIDFAGSSNIFNTYGFNGPLKAYVSPGGRPRLTIGESTGGPTSFSQATLTGYYVDLTP